ncbi:MAG: XdhC family protein [Deltaproteobacteria bacterium]|nr:XdhC family protein [Deltaproteobacteria bacterium]
MNEINGKILELFKEDRFSVLATLIRVSGSTPRGVGTKFLVMDDGSILGTIGGGLLEAQVQAEAQKVLASFSPRRFRFVLRGVDVAETDMLCGGDTEVFLEPVLPNNLNHLHLFKRIMEIEQRGGKGILATIINEEQWQGGQIPKMFMEPDGPAIGSLLGLEEVEAALADRMPELLEGGRPEILRIRDREGASLELFVEPVASDPVLYIFGGGHVSSQIVPLAARVGFKVVVVDDRSDFADPQRFPDAAQVLEHPFDDVVESLPVDESSYLVIVTRGHIHDKNVLAQCLHRSAKYVGMIGSRRKISIIFDKLIEEGFSREDLDRVHSPIGLQIGAETPEEIAVAIVAQLIQVRAGSDRGK